MLFINADGTPSSARHENPFETIIKSYLNIFRCCQWRFGFQLWQWSVCCIWLWSYIAWSILVFRWESTNIRSPGEHKCLYISNWNLYFEVSKVVGCQMIKQSFDLPYSFYGGSCNSFSMPDEKVLMCFSYQTNSPKSCHLWVN